MTSVYKMMRIVLLPLLLFTISMACMGQTFQYSRGWTNGKRAMTSVNARENRISDFFESPIEDRHLEKCLLHLQQAIRNPLLLQPGALTLSLNSGNPSSKRNNGNTNTNLGNDFLTNHHQSNELYEEMNAAEPNEYAKH